MIQPSADLFLEACGARGPVRLHIDGNGTGTKASRVFDRPFILIGRDQNNDLCLDHPTVSERHAYLQLLGGNLYCVDLGSGTGLTWEHGPSPTGWLKPNQILRIGPYAIRWEGADSAAIARGDSNPSASLSQPPDQTVLEFVNGRPGSTWTMNRVLTLVGKASECAVRLKVPGVADYHCSLLRTARGLWAVGLDTGDGIHVNGQGLRWAMLTNGDEITVGKILIRVRQSLATTAPESVLSGNGMNVAPGALPDEVLMPLLSQFTVLQRQMFDQFQQAVYMMVEMFKKMEREHAELMRKEVDRIHEITEELKLLQMELRHQTPLPYAAEKTRIANHPIGSWNAPAWKDQTANLTPAASEPLVTGEPPESLEAEQEMHTWLYDQIAMLQRERESRLQKLINFLSGQR